MCPAVQDVSLETKPLELLACVTSRSLRGKDFNTPLCLSLTWCLFCEQRTGRINCSFAVGHELQGFLQRVIQCDQDRLVKEPCLNSLVVLPEGRHLSLRRETVITQTSSICSTFQWESPKSS